MWLLSYYVYFLIAFYIAMGALILWLAARPSCRICVRRGNCPNRVPGFVVPDCVERNRKAGPKNPGPHS